MKRLLIAAAVAVALAGSPSAAAGASRAEAAGSVGLRLLGVPALVQDDPRARLYVVDHLAPGAQIQRRIVVTNTTRSAARVALYPAGATIARGAFLGAAGHTRDELSTWTSIDPRRSRVPPGGITEVNRVGAGAPPTDARRSSRACAARAVARST